MVNSTSATNNVEASNALGLTAYLTPRGAEIITEMFEPNEGYRQFLTFLSEPSENEPLHKLQLDQGIYSTWGGSCHFHCEAACRGEIIVPVTGSSFKLGNAYVVRIESSNGDVWQNWHYTSDGQPKR